MLQCAVTQKSAHGWGDPAARAGETMTGRRSRPRSHDIGGQQRCMLRSLRLVCSRLLRGRSRGELDCTSAAGAAAPMHTRGHRATDHDTLAMLKPTTEVQMHYAVRVCTCQEEAPREPCMGLSVKGAEMVGCSTIDNLHCCSAAVLHKWQRDASAASAPRVPR